MNEGVPTKLALDRIARLNGGVIRLARADRRIDEYLADAGRPVSRNRLSIALSDLVARGDAIRVSNGIYILRSERGHINPVAAGPRLTTGRAYVSMWNVAERARLTYNQPRLVSVVVDRAPSRPRMDVPSLDVVFFFHAIASPRFFGFTETPLGDGLTAPLASVEKALIDMLWFTEASDVPPASELFEMWEVAAGSTSLNPRLLLRYAVQMESPAVARRVGYLMDRFGISGADDLLAHRGASKKVLPLLRADEHLDLPTNRWGVR